MQTYTLYRQMLHINRQENNKNNSFCDGPSQLSQSHQKSKQQVDTRRPNSSECEWNL